MQLLYPQVWNFDANALIYHVKLKPISASLHVYVDFIFACVDLLKIAKFMS